VVGDQTFGALDVQSTQEAAFTEEDISTLGTLADQISVAIENARLFAQTQTALQAAQEAQARYLRQEWSNCCRRCRSPPRVPGERRAARG